MSVSQCANVAIGRNAFAYNPELAMSNETVQKKRRKPRSDIGVKRIPVEMDVNTGKFMSQGIIVQKLLR